jgi:hypothetical protein
VVATVAGVAAAVSDAGMTAAVSDASMTAAVSDAGMTAAVSNGGMTAAVSGCGLTAVVGDAAAALGGAHAMSAHGAGAPEIVAAHGAGAPETMAAKATATEAAAAETAAAPEAMTAPAEATTAAETAGRGVGCDQHDRTERGRRHGDDRGAADDGVDGQFRHDALPNCRRMIPRLQWRHLRSVAPRALLPREQASVPIPKFA